MSAAIATIGAAVNLLAALAQATQEVSALVANASAQGRTTLTTEEWDALTAKADAAHAALEAALGRNSAAVAALGAAPAADAPPAPPSGAPGAP